MNNYTEKAKQTEAQIEAILELASILCPARFPPIEIHIQYLSKATNEKFRIEIISGQNTLFDAKGNCFDETLFNLSKLLEHRAAVLKDEVDIARQVVHNLFNE